MKSRFLNSPIPSLVCAILAILIPACSFVKDEPSSGVYMKLNVRISEDNYSLSDLSDDSPFHVVAFKRYKDCKPFCYSFEENAYANSAGQLKWCSGDRHEWPLETMKFIAYWPADANVVIDGAGNVVSADCELIAVSEPVNYDSQNVIFTFSAWLHIQDWNIVNKQEHL